MANNLSGISFTNNFNNLDGLSVVDADVLYIDGQQVDLDNLLPYTGATKEVDLNSQNIKTTHMAVAGPDLVNLTTLQNAITYIDTSVANTFLNKTTTTAQTMASDTDWGTHKITSSYVPTANVDLTNKLYVDGQDALKVSKSGDTMTGTLNMGTNLITSSYVPTANNHVANKLYVDNAVAGGSGSALLASNNIWTGTNNFNGTLFQANSDTLYTIREALVYTAANFTAVSGTIVDLGGGSYRIVGGPNGGTATISGAFPYKSVLYRITISCAGSIGGCTLTLTQNGTSLYTANITTVYSTYTTITFYVRPPWGASYDVNWVFYAPTFGGYVYFKDLTIERVKANVNVGLGQLTCENAPSASTDVANKGYVDSAVAGVGSSLLSATNTWTGTSNTFNNDLLAGKDFYIGANSSAWNTTFTKGLYMRYSTNSGQDGAYIQSVDRTGPTAKPLSFYGSPTYFQGGNVGIQWDTPASTLDVNGDLRVRNNTGNGYVILNAGGATRTGYINFYNADTNRMGYIGYGDATDFLFNIEQSRNIRFYVGAVDAMKIKSTGTVAITNSASTFAPYNYCKLYVHDTSTSGWAGMSYFGGATSGIVMGQYNNGAGYANYLGAHNAALTAWSDVYLCPGGSLSIGNNIFMLSGPNLVNNTGYHPIYNMLARDPNNGQIVCGSMNISGIRNNSVAWTGGYYIPSAIYRSTANSAIIMNGHVSCYSATVQSMAVCIRLNPSGVPSYQYYYTNYFFNSTYNHTNIPINYILTSIELGTSTGYWDVYVVSFTANVLSDSNDVVHLTFLGLL